MLTTNLILFINLKSLFLQTPKDNLAYKLTSWLNSCPVLKKSLFATHNTDSNISIYAQLQFGERFKVKLHNYGRYSVLGHVNQPLDTKIRPGRGSADPTLPCKKPRRSKITDIDQSRTQPELYRSYPTSEAGEVQEMTERRGASRGPHESKRIRSMR